MIDRVLGDQYQIEEALRCIHIGLLCTQKDPAERPSMATVILMLSNYIVTLPAPSAPAFCMRSDTISVAEVFGWDTRTGLSASERSGGNATGKSRMIEKSRPESVNDVSITDMEPR